MSDETEVQIEQDGEYTRFRMNIQRGEGVDRRGDVTVEMVRETAHDSTATVEYSNRSQKIRVDNEAFSEFVFETDRAVTLLENRLGLTGGDGDA